MIPLKDDVVPLRTPVINWLFIALNVAVFLFELAQGSHINSFVAQWALTPKHFAEHTNIHQVETIFTAMFMHGGWLHLIGNMWALLIFGGAVEDRMGHWRYFWFYTICGIAAAMAQVYMVANAAIPSLGASGAIAGIMAAYLVYYPQSRVLTYWGFLFFFWLPAWFAVGEWFVVQLVHGSFELISNSANQTGVAFFAHIGGFITGLVLAKIFEDPNSYPPARTERILQQARF